MNDTFYHMRKTEAQHLRALYLKEVQKNKELTYQLKQRNYYENLENHRCGSGK